MQKSIGKKATVQFGQYLQKQDVNKYSRHAGVSPLGTTYRIKFFFAKTNQNILGNANLA